MSPMRNDELVELLQLLVQISRPAQEPPVGLDVHYQLHIAGWLCARLNSSLPELSTLTCSELAPGVPMFCHIAKLHLETKSARRAWDREACV